MSLTCWAVRLQAFVVSPVLAALILPFERHEARTPAQLAAASGIPHALAMRKCAGLAGLLIFCLLLI